jgi:hypothetical protein
MGTVGGKIGFIAGVAVAFIASTDAIRLVLGGCFFEGGCGPNDEPLLLLAAVLSALIGFAAGLATRAVVNALLPKR